MFRYTIKIYEENVWQTLGDVALPITDGTILDDTLDEGRIDIRNTTRSRAIKPFTRLVVICYENDVFVKKIQRVVGTAKRVRKRNGNPALYDWSIQTLELTKLLERDVIGSMTATKPKQHNAYAIADVQSARTTSFVPQDPESDLNWVVIENEDNIIEYSQLPIYRQDYPKGQTFTFSYDWASLKRGYWWGLDRTNIYLNGNKIDGTTLNERGQYTIETILYAFEGSNPQVTYRLAVTWRVNAVEQEDYEREFTISSVTKRLLYAGITRRDGVENQKYTLNTAFAEKYADIEAPEFAFTNSTLLDALFQIGGAIHAIPRLQVKNESEFSNDLEYEITFDKLGGDEEVGHLMPQWVSEDVTIDINDFCDTLDSPAQNLVNSVDIDKGCISEFGNNFITIRTENSQVEISADTMAIRTALPIQRLVKLECLYDGTIDDITPYVYEMAEYSTLSTLKSSSYPYSTNYALCYSIGGDVITGLNNKPTTATVLEDLGNDYQYAIVKILNALRGNTINITNFKAIDLAFRVTYVPIVSARVTQKKPIKTDNDGNTLVYNQGANLVETNAYGQKMRGAIARLGLAATRRTYDFFSFADVPKVGQKINGEYIVQVDCAYYPTKIRATLLLTPNFNQISQYVGLNTNYRLYDISERQTVDRFITYGEIIEVGNATTYNPKAIMNKNKLSAVLNTMFTGGGGAFKRVDTAMTRSRYKGGNAIADSEVLLPVASFAFGQSLAFVCAFVDNYGAGYQATDNYLTDDAKYKRVQRLVPYADMFGEIDTLDLYFKSGTVWDNQTQIALDIGQANVYPKATDSVENAYINDAFMSTGDYPLILSKDSAERIGITYQAHFQANRESIVIGKAMTENCPMVANINYPPHNAYCFNHELNNLSSYDISQEVSQDKAQAISYTFATTTDGVSVTPNLPSSDVKAWAIFDNNNNIYIGENTSVATPIHITIT